MCRLEIMDLGELVSDKKNPKLPDAGLPLNALCLIASNSANRSTATQRQLGRSLSRSNGEGILRARVLVLRQIKKSPVPARTSVDDQIEQAEKFGWKRRKPENLHAKILSRKSGENE